MDAKARFMKDEPKRPSSSYFIFLEEMRPKNRDENPGIGMGDMQKKLSVAWNEISSEEKQRLSEKEKQLKEEYEEKMAEFQKSANYRKYQIILNKISGKGKGSKEKGPVAPEKPSSMPKKPLNAMVMYGKTVGGGLKEMHAAWTKLGADGQKEWVEKAKAEDDKYNRELVAFNKSAEGKKYNREKAAFDKRQRLAAARMRFLGKDGVPPEPKRPPTAYFVFVGRKRADVAKENPGIKMGD